VWATCCTVCVIVGIRTRQSKPPRRARTGFMARGTRQLLVVGPCALEHVFGVRHNNITSWLLVDSTFQPAREYVLAHQTNNTPGSIRKQRRRNNDTSSVASTAAHRFCLVGLTRLSSQSQVQAAPQREQVSCRARRLLPRWCRFSPPTSNNHCRFRTAIRNQKTIYAALEWSLPWLPGARGRTRASRSLRCGRRRGRAGRSGGRCRGK